MTPRPLIPLLLGASLLLGLSGCGNMYVTAATAAGTMVGGQVMTGRNIFYTLDKRFGRPCNTYTFFDRPAHCVNDPKDNFTVTNG